MGAGLVTLAIVACLASAAFLLLQNKSTPKSPLDSSRTTPSTRGTILRFTLGRFLCGPVIGYIGNRATKEEEVEGSGGGGKGLGGGGKKAKQTIYYETGMHILSLGRGKSIRAIYQSGKNILGSPIHSFSSPSGSTFSLKKEEGTFTVYWGESNQPVNSRLRSITSLNTSYPHIFYIVWNPKRLGPQAVWPNLEYDIEVDHPADFTPPTGGGYSKSMVVLFSLIVQVGSDEIPAESTSIFGISSKTPNVFVTTNSNASKLKIGDTLQNTSLGYSTTVINIFFIGSSYLICGSTIPPLGEDAYVTLEFLKSSRSGVNPASALKQMLFHPAPFGLGFNESLFNMGDFNTVSTLLVSEGSDACTVTLANGKSFQDGIVSVMQDFGIMMYKDTETGKYGFVAVREHDEITNITLSEYNGDEIAQTLAYAVLDADKLIFVYSDSAKKFSDSSIIIVNDAGTKFSENPQTKKIALGTITDLQTANSIVSRRQQEESVSESLTLNASDSLINLRPGTRCSIEGFHSYYRLAEKKIDPLSATVELSFLQDAYSINTEGYIEIGNPNIPSSSSYSSVPDPHVSVFEPTRLVAPNSDFIMVGRVRYGNFIVGGNVYASPDGSSYTLSKACLYSIGGTLAGDWNFKGSLEENGPEFTSLGPDISAVKNLTGQESSWRSGSQLMLIGDELIYLRNIDVSTMTLKGLLRGRLGTVSEDYSEGTQFVILPLSAVEEFRFSFLSAGTSIYVKTQPYSSYDVTSLDNVTPVLHNYKGGGYRPLPVTNLNTEDLTSSFEAGEDISFKWSYMSGGDTGAAGMGLSGELSSSVAPESSFSVEILNGTTVVRTETVTSNMYTYTAAKRLSDFSSSEPSSFNIKVTGLLSGLTSIPDYTTIKLVS